MAAIRTMSKQAAHQTEFWLDSEHTTSTCVLIAILLGFFGVLLVKKSWLGRHCGGDNIDNMSAEEAKVEKAAEMCCASCGITTDVNDMKLKECTDFDLVRYCSDKCQQEHQTQHEAISKDRAAELRDEILFRQPESTHVGDCPICLLPLRLDPAKSLFYSCCSKMICKGCDHANKLRQREEQLECTCPFCRQVLPDTQDGVDKNFMNRAATNNDPVALRLMGMKHYREGDYDAAFKCHTKAVDLGDVGAKFHLAHLYMGGEGVDKDMKMGLHYYEEAAIAGHPRARYSRACYEMVDGRIDRAVKHWIIAANLGDDDSIQTLKGFYARGEVSKEEFAAALRAHYAAVDATKSPQREAAEAEEG